MGPGAYGSERFKFIKGGDKSPKGNRAAVDSSQTLQPQPVFGTEKRFRDPRFNSPGPGQYADVNKWHKKTYNLKFLNVA